MPVIHLRDRHRASWSIQCSIIADLDAPPIPAMLVFSSAKAGSTLHIFVIGFVGFVAIVFRFAVSVFGFVVGLFRLIVRLFRLVVRLFRFVVRLFRLRIIIILEVSGRWPGLWVGATVKAVH